MSQKLTHILIFLLLFCHINVKAQTHVKLKPKNIVTILKLWNGNGNQFEMFPVAVWEKMMENGYQDALKSNDTALLFEIKVALGSIYHDQAKFDKALPIFKELYLNKSKLNSINYEWLLIGLEEEYRSYHEMKNALFIRNERIHNGFINTYWELYRDCGLLEAAKKDFLQFQQIAPSLSMKEMKYFHNLGDIYFELNQIDSAIIIYKKGQIAAQNAIKQNKKTKVYRETDLLYYYGLFKGNIGKCYTLSGEFAKAIPFLLEDISLSYENLYNKAEKMFYLTDCYLHFNKIILAKSYLDSGSEISNEINNHNIDLQQLKTSAHYFTVVKKYDSALLYFNNYANTKDTIDAKIKENQSVFLLVQLELTNRRSELYNSATAIDQKNKQLNAQKYQLYAMALTIVLAVAFVIALYLNFSQKNKSKKLIEIQNEQLQISSELIKRQNDKNEILLKELHHRVKNNLQVMYSLLNLQKRRNKDEETKNSLISIQNRIQTMALVHQNLYTTGDFENVELTSYIKTLVSHLESIYKINSKKIEIIFSIGADLSIPIEKIVSIGLVINEAVSNAFKYAFNNTSTGKLIINIHSQNGICTVEIKDNGPGFNEAQINENSLGMKLINVMCAQLKAKYDIDKTNGVTHRISF